MKPTAGPSNDALKLTREFKRAAVRDGQLIARLSPRPRSGETHDGRA
jgi:hypothetical protein